MGTIKIVVIVVVAVVVKPVQSNPVILDTEGAIENVCIKGVSVLRGFFSPETSQTVCNDQVSVLSGCP